MAQFSYEIRDSKGARLSGEMKALDEHAALNELTRNGSVVVKLLEVSTSSSSGVFGLSKKISVDSILTFFGQFTFLVRSGMPLFQSLEMVIAQTDDQVMQKVLIQIRQDLTNGSSLSEAMKRHHEIFKDLYISMVVVGEGSGKLDQAFERIVDVIEDERALKQKISKIVNYVIFMLSIAFVVMSGVLIFVFPKFSAIFTKVGMDLPITTEIMITLSEFIFSHKISLPLSMCLIIVSIVLFFRSETGRETLDKLKFNFPVVKDIAINASLAEFTRTFSSLLATGVSVLDALEICRESTSNRVLKPIITRLIKDVREGSSISESLSGNDLFPPVMIQLTAAGENSGELDKMMDNIHLYFKQRVEDSVSRFTATMEPAMLVILGGLVLIMAMSIFLPMFNLAGAIRK